MLTLPYFIRITAAIGSDELYDWVFDIPVKRYLTQKVKSADILSSTDYVFLILLLKDYYLFQNEHHAEDILDAIFNALSQHLFHDPSENAFQNDSNKFDANNFGRFYNMFYDNRNLIGYSYPDISVDDHHIGMLMHSGGTMIWQDVRNLLAWYLTDNNISMNYMKSRSVLNRIRITSEQSYKVDDLLNADEEMQLNGIFFSACCLAGINNLLLNKICADGSAENINPIRNILYGISSFFSCVRILEQDSDRSQYLKEFWAFFRQTAADSHYHMDQLRNMSETVQEYLPARALRYYED